MTHASSLLAAISAALLLAGQAAHAQRPSGGDTVASGKVAPSHLIVKTIPLRSLEPRDAASLIAPYIVSEKGGVFDAGRASAITVRETGERIQMIEAVLRERDRVVAPVTLTLRFQLIAADSVPASDPAIEPVASSLRELFKFRGYRLLSEGVTTTSAHHGYTVTLSDGDGRVTLTGMVEDVEADGRSGSVNLKVTLTKNTYQVVDGKPSGREETLLGTGVTIPLGQTVVLGSAAAAGGRRQALILVVRPEVASVGRR